MPERIVIDIQTKWVPAPQVVANAFFTAAEKIAHMEVPLGDVIDLLKEQYEMNFQAEGRPSKWTPLAESTIKERERQGYGAGPILTRSSALRDSVDEWTMAGSGQLAVATMSAATYGTYHITGFRGGWNHDRAIPARDWTYIDPGVEENIDAIMADWVMKPMAEVPGA